MTTMRTGARTLARLRRLAAASLATVCASLAVPAPALASAAPVPRDHHLPAAPSASLVPAHPVTAGRPVAPPAANVVTSVPAPNWPAAGAADVDLPATAPAGAATGVTATGVGTPAMVPVRAGGLPVQVGSSSASRVRVQVPGHAAAQQAGATGFLFRMDRTDGGGQPAPVTARLDYSGFAQAYGGGFASRLTVVALPSCAATTPQLPACQVATPVPTANDLSARTLTVQMNAQPAITSPTSTLRAAASGSRSAGGTAVLAVTTTTSGGTGDFTWQYPFRVPPPIGGHAPAVSLAYDSAPRPARPVPVARRMLRPVCPSRCDSRTSASRVCCWRRV